MYRGPISVWPEMYLIAAEASVELNEFGRRSRLSGRLT